MRITLVGNYAPDRQQSMLRYAGMLQESLSRAGHDVRLVAPQRRLPRFGRSGARKWIGYADKFLLGWRELRSAQRHADVVHVCDHSNAMYVPVSRSVPHTVTCHDLLAVRGARGEMPDCAASPTGRVLQAWILRGLARADAVACVSQATRRDFSRLLPAFGGDLSVIPNGLNYDYRRLSSAEELAASQPLPAALQGRRYLLHVGSAHMRKNRETAMHVLARLGARWDGLLVFAGEPLTAAQWRLVADLAIGHRVVECVEPDNEQLRALYCRAQALLFTSRHEGFGWPLIEAQACGCPVLCSDTEPMPEVSGGVALFAGADDATGFADHVVALSQDLRLRDDLVRRGLERARLHSVEVMAGALEALLQRVVDRWKQPA